MKRILIFFFAVMSLCRFSFAAFEKGGIQSPGAAAAGVGYACAAKAAGADSVFYNPAALFISESSGISLMYGSLANTKAQDLYGVLYGYFRPYLSVAASAGSMYRENTAEYTYQITLSVPVFREASYFIGTGSNIKFLNSFYEEQAYALTADVGAIAAAKDIWFLEQLSLGAVYKDINARLRHANGLEEEINSSITAGIAARYYGFELSGDFNYIMNQNKEEYNYSAGLSKDFEMFILRAGFAGFQTIAPAFTAGAGVMLGDFTADYAFVSHASGLGATHRIQASYLFGKPNPEYIPAPVKCSVYAGDSKALVKWSSVSGQITGYRLYITAEGGDTVEKETEGRADVDFIITGMENGKKYSIQITAFSGRLESEKSDMLNVIPSAMSGRAKLFYKKAELLYIDGKYKAAIEVLKQAGNDAALTADYIIFRERLEKLSKIK
ncbi:MAG TPA: fibronectin type III domain-containing protein [Candidatus Goldiibacteriota bacterium]|nr:fibronectin type III domain-containing protein [Candidatus Goldiibacteriota bacterium]HPN64140.1 fibronectin type III domain-containing protein [Candidatus Goldiibacteriota bacterium]HRQ43265.1 fibronectin type III domain-containing protein [Candidatus Goldiibacteriota bacterium]